MRKKIMLLCCLTLMISLSLGLYGCRKDSDKSSASENADTVSASTEIETSAANDEIKTSAEETLAESGTTETDPTLTEADSESEEEKVHTESGIETETTETESANALETTETGFLTEDTSEAATILNIEGDVEIIIPDDMGDGGL